MTRIDEQYWLYPRSRLKMVVIMDPKVGLTEQQDVTTTQARQAIAPHRLRYMLVAGTAAVVLGFFAVYFLVS